MSAVTAGMAPLPLADLRRLNQGAALLPFLQLLPDEATRAEFLADYLAAITPHYPRQADGKVLLPFRRLFVIAYR